MFAEITNKAVAEVSIKFAAIICSLPLKRFTNMESEIKRRTFWGLKYIKNYFEFFRKFNKL